MPKTTESTTKFKVDISDFKRSMQEATRLTRLAESEFKAATAGMGKWSDSIDGVTAKMTQLDKVLEVQKRQLAILEKEYEEVAKEQGESSKGAQELKIKINNQMAAIKKTESDLSHYGDRLEELKKGEDNLGDSMEDASKKAEQSSEGFTVMKGALASLVADGIKLAVKGLKDLGREAVQAYKEFDTGRDSVIKATGATGEAAKQLTKSYQKVAENVKGDFADIGKVVGEVATRFNASDKELETISEDFVKFAEITGTDATEAVRLVSRAMGDAGIDLKDYRSILDELTAASQTSGIAVDTLAETLTKYGAPMRALGFDTKESIALFSAWEKSGVNTATAFSGLRKAISNWSKDGKDARVEFKKTLEEIKKTPNIAKATEKAIETFGQKAGPDLADAIYNGRFEYTQFIETLEGSDGIVKKTYEETQDGFDKVDLAIQKGRIRLANFIDKIVNKYEPQIEKAIAQGVKGIEGFVGAVGKVFKFILDNKDVVLSALKAIATAFITYKAVNTITSVITGFQTLVTAIKAGESAMVALNGVMSLSPWGLLIAGVTAAGVGLLSYAEYAKEAELAQYGLNYEQEQSIENAKEIADQYRDLDKARDENNAGIVSEFDYLKQLKREYNELVGADGKIKEGYEARAEFILNQLADAMGVEREEIDKTIKKNGELGKSLDDLMIKQQAQAILDSNQSAYNEAIGERADALKTYQDNLESVKQEEQKYNSLLRQANMTEADFYGYRKAKESGDWEKQLEYRKTYTKEVLDALETTFDAYNKAQDGLFNAEDAYVGYSQTIQNYEGLAVAVLEGDSKKIKEAMNKLQNDVLTAETGNARTLEAQAKKFKENYENMQQAVADGIAGVSENDINASKALMDKANKELIKYFKSSDVAKEAIKRGYEIPQSLTKGLKEGYMSVDSATKALQKLISFDKGEYGVGYAAIAKNLGLEIPKNIADGIVNGTVDVEQADASMLAVIETGLKSAAFKAGIAAEDIPENIAMAVREGDMTIEEAVKQIKTTVTDNLSDDDGKAKEKGEDVVNNFVGALTAGLEAVGNAAKDLADEANSNLEVDTETSGENFVQGFINGIKSFLGVDSDIKKAVTKVGKLATESLKEAQQEGSPSEITTQSGKYFTQGYINGIKSLISEAGKAALELGKTTVSNLKLGMDVDTSSLTSTLERKIELTNLKLSSQIESTLKKYDKTINKLEASRDSEIKKLEKQRDSVTDKATKELITKQITETQKKYKALIKAEKKAKETYQTASNAMMTDFAKAMSEYKDKAYAYVDEVIGGIADKYNNAYDALLSKQDSLIEKMRSAGELFEISTAGVMTVNDITTQTQQIKDYADKLKAVKGKVSSELFDEIASYDMKEGSAFLDYLLAMDEETFKAYNEAFSTKYQLSEQLANELYSDDFSQLGEQYNKAMKSAFAIIPSTLEELGRQSMQSFIKGLKEDTQYMSKEVKSIIKEVTSTFKQENAWKWTDGLTGAFNALKLATQDLMDSASVKLNLGDISGIQQSIPQQSTTTSVVNNYNLVQNNTSPKSLSALETYTARRQQLAMLKALS